MMQADLILAFIDRDVTDGMLGLTTNYELGRFWTLPWLFLGGPAGPDTRQKHTYLRNLWTTELKREWASTVGLLVEQAVRWYRTQLNSVLPPPLTPEPQQLTVPAQIRATPDFQSWHARILQNQNSLLEFNLVDTLAVGPGRRLILGWSAKVAIKISSEDRVKYNETISSRVYPCSIVVYCPEEANVMATKVLMVREFRSTQGAHNIGLPSGSDLGSNFPPAKVILDELAEETGLVLTEDHLVDHGQRTVAGTLIATSVHLFSCHLLPAEMADLEASLTQDPIGNEEESERVYPQIFSLADLSKQSNVDFLTLGCIFQVLNSEIRP